MSTALINSRANEIYAKIDNPMTAIAELGKLFHQSAIMGVSTPGDGAVLALTCMCEGITPLEFAKTYHIIKGRPSMRADMMSAKFRQAGGKCNWINLGDDGKEARATFEYDGQSLEIAYTIQDAKNVVGDKLDTPDSNWRKDRGAMLRARLITKAIRIIAPELIAGVYTPEELDDALPQDQPAKETAKKREQRRKELEQAEEAPVVSDAVIDVVPESPPFETEKAAEAADPDDGDELVTPELLQEIVKVGSKMPSRAEPGKGMTLTEISAGICAACKVEKPQQATRKQIRTLIGRFRATLGG